MSTQDNDANDTRTDDQEPISKGGVAGVDSKEPDFDNDKPKEKDITHPKA